MWSERDRRYGGLLRRYSQFRRGTVRCLDPVRRAPVAFATGLHYENWLLHWAMPGVRNLMPHAAKLTCLDGGYKRSISPDLQFERDGIEIQIVVARGGPESAARSYDLERVAQAHDFRWTVRTREQIRADPLLIANLDGLRQCMTLHADDFAWAMMRRIERLLIGSRCCTRADIRARVSLSVPDTMVDAVLMWLHREGVIELDLAGGAYGYQTKIHLR
jgi:hypothetical protein